VISGLEEIVPRYLTTLRSIIAPWVGSSIIPVIGAPLLPDLSTEDRRLVTREPTAEEALCLGERTLTRS